MASLEDTATEWETSGELARVLAASLNVILPDPATLAEPDSPPWKDSAEMSTDGDTYRMEDDIELLADRYARKTMVMPGASKSAEPALLSKRQVAALIRDAWTDGYIKGRKVQDK